MSSSKDLLRQTQVAPLRESLEQPPDQLARRQRLAAASSLVYYVRQVIADDADPVASQVANELVAAAIVLWLTARSDGPEECFDAFDVLAGRAVEHAMGLSS